MSEVPLDGTCKTTKAEFWPWLDSGFGFQVKFLKIFLVVASRKRVWREKLFKYGSIHPRRNLISEQNRIVLCIFKLPTLQIMVDLLR